LDSQSWIFSKLDKNWIVFLFSASYFLSVIMNFQSLKFILNKKEIERQKINVGLGVGDDYSYKIMSEGVMWFSDYGTTPTSDNVIGILDCADLLQVGRAAQIQGTELFAVRCRCGTVKVSTQKTVTHCSDNCKTLNNLKP
jgi:hypothetical protein